MPTRCSCRSRPPEPSTAAGADPQERSWSRALASVRLSGEPGILAGDPRTRTPPVTSNLHPSGFDTIMPKTLATATVDRLLHHAHIVLTEGTSLRLAEATTGRGVVPLT
ncbi:MAG: ATP-binding protein [Pseudonocardiaceae bacterium]